MSSLALLLLKATLLLGVAVVATLVMARRSAGSRHLVWLTALISLLVLPAMAKWGGIRVLPAAVAADRVQIAPNTPSERVGTPSPGLTVPDVHTAARSATPAARSWLQVVESLPTLSLLMIAWFAVTAGLLLRLGYGAYAVRRIVRRAMLLDSPSWQGPLYEIADRLELQTAPVLLRSSDVKMPFACGIFRSTIILPAESVDWSADRRSAVLIHELGHVRRRDLFGHTLGRITCALYWFHPMVWSAARHLRAESERACDDMALLFGTRPSDYAEHLLDIVTSVRDHATPSIALALAHRKEFEGRMLAILNPDLQRAAPRRWQTVSLVGVLGLLAVVISAAAPMHSVVAPAPKNNPLATADISPPAPIAAPLTAATPHAPGAANVNVNVDVSRAMAIETRVNRVVNTVRSAAPAAAAELDTMKGAARAALLAKLLREDSAASVRRVAAWALQGLGESPTVLHALAEALANDHDEDVRETSAWALAEMDGADITALRNAARVDHSARVRETATWALARHDDEVVANTLADIVADDRDANVRATAAWALGTVSPKRVPKGLVNALTDASEDVRFKAAWAVAAIGDASVSNAVSHALDVETSAHVREVQLRVLIMLGQDSESMVKWLKSSDPKLREMAVRALSGGRATDPWPWPWPRPRP